MPENLDVIFNVQYQYTVKKVKRFSHPQPGRHYPKLSMAGSKLFPCRESLVMDIPAGDEKIANLFLQCSCSVKGIYWTKPTFFFLSSYLAPPSPPPFISWDWQDLHPTHKEERARERKGSGTHTGRNTVDEGREC